MEKIKQYVLEKYPRTFTKKIIHRDSRGKISKRETIQLPILIEDCGSHWTVKPNKDASPIILSKNI